MKAAGPTYALETQFQPSALIIGKDLGDQEMRGDAVRQDPKPQGIYKDIYLYTLLYKQEICNLNH